MSTHRLKDGRWIVKIPDPDKAGGSRREYFGRGAEAESKARARDKSLGLKITRPTTNQDYGVCFQTIMDAYYLSRQTNAASLLRLKISLQATISPVFGNVPASKLTHSDLDKFVNERRLTVKSSTVRRDVAIIQAIMNYAVRRRPPMIPDNPLRGYPLPKTDDEIIIPPTAAEVAAIMEQGNDRLRRFVKIAWYCGLRPGSSELLSLNFENILWEQGVIRVISAKKGGIQMREVPIHPGFLPELREWAEAAGYKGPIISYSGNRMHHMHWSWVRAKKKAGISRRLRLYDLRHFFVTSAIEAGADYKTLSEIVGSNPETLRKYYQHVSSAARVKLIENMPSFPAFPVNK